MSFAVRSALLVVTLMAFATLSVEARAAGDIEAGKTKAGMCFGCHGVDGNGGADPIWPKLAGQDPAYLVKQLKDFKATKRMNPIMMGMAGVLDDQGMADIAAYYGSLPPKPGSAADASLAQAGERIYRGGVAKQQISACMSCHGPSGMGIPPRFPRVAGQGAAYIEAQLLAFKKGERTNDGDVMTRIAFRMSEAQIKAVSQFMSGLHSVTVAQAAKK